MFDSPNRVANTWKKASVAIALAGILVATSACTSETIKDSATVTSAPTNVAQETKAADATPVSKDPTVKLGAVVKSTKGEYRQVELADDSDALKYHPSIVQAVVLEKYTQEDITEATKAMMDFVVPEIIDSPLNGGGETADQWWERNKDEFSPIAAVDAKANLSVTNPDGSSKSLPSDENWQRNPEYKGYEYIYDANTPRVKNLSIDPFEVFLDDEGYIATAMYLSYDMPYTFGDKSGDMKVSGELRLSMVKNNGKWLVNGFNRSTTTASTGLK